MMIATMKIANCARARKQAMSVRAECWPREIHQANDERHGTLEVVGRLLGLTANIHDIVGRLKFASFTCVTVSAWTSSAPRTARRDTECPSARAPSLPQAACSDQRIALARCREQNRAPSSLESANVADAEEDARPPVHHAEQTEHQLHEPHQVRKAAVIRELLPVCQTRQSPAIRSGHAKRDNKSRPDLEVRVELGEPEDARDAEQRVLPDDEADKV